MASGIAELLVLVNPLDGGLPHAVLFIEFDEEHFSTLPTLHVQRNDEKEQKYIPSRRFVQLIAGDANIFQNHIWLSESGEYFCTCGMFALTDFEVIFVAPIHRNSFGRERRGGATGPYGEANHECSCGEDENRFRASVERFDVHE